MSFTVFAAVLFAALLHASWNALLKHETDKYAGAVGVALGGVVPALVCLAVTGLPATAAWPAVLASAAIHTLYFLCLSNAYRAADFTQVYPVARGISPVLTAIFGLGFLGETLTPIETAGVATVAAGVISLVFANAGERRFTASGLAWALATGAMISAYSLNDGFGARLAGNSVSFYAAAATLNAIAMAALASLRSPGALKRVFTVARRSTLLGGPLSFLAYAIITWAFTQAPIAAVSALRETSIVFAVAIGAFVLREHMNWRKALSASITLAGAILLRFAAR